MNARTDGSWAVITAKRELENEPGQKVSRAKKRLKRDAASKMNAARLGDIDAAGEVSGWLKKIHAMLA